MGDVASDRTALERLRVQRGRLADRMRPPWWYLPGFAIVWALFFAGPFSSRSFSSPRAVSTWLILVPAVAVCCLLQWGPAAIVVAALAVAAEVAAQQVLVRGIRQDLRAGGGA